MDKTVVYCGTRNMYRYMETAAKSLLCNTLVDHVFFLIEDDAFTCNLPDIITTINVSDQFWFDHNGPNYKSTWTYMAFLRLAFTRLFPHHERILYLDTDTLVLQDVSELLSLDLSTNLFAMVREDTVDLPLEIVHAFAVAPTELIKARSDNPRPDFAIRPYFNSGVMLMNLRELRLSGTDEIMIHKINTTKYKYPDQDVINTVCFGRILPLAQEYNVIPALFPDFPSELVRIKHFASDKPLWKSSLWQSYRRLSWDDVMNQQNILKGANT